MQFICDDVDLTCENEHLHVSCLWKYQAHMRNHFLFTCENIQSNWKIWFSNTKRRIPRDVSIRGTQMLSLQELCWSIHLWFSSNNACHTAAIYMWVLLSPRMHSEKYSPIRLEEGKMDGGKATYVVPPGRGVGSGSGKEDKGIFFYNRINNIAPRFLPARAASYKQESLKTTVAKRSQIYGREKKGGKNMTVRLSECVKHSSQSCFTVTFACQ